MSSSDIAVSVRGLGKSYTIRQNVPKHGTLADAIADRLRHPFRRNSTKDTFWALKDVAFDIKKGEVVGIIGRNGAGKSTLLKILSRITQPTLGEIDVFGRVGSLLEVGTGFHPELTGRENIFLNGSILGMSRAEIRREFDAIVDFAGVERFLDTPVKRYSSGMYVRLAFSVATRLRTEILVVDEVLAVGDVEFQKKCLGRVEEVSQRDGRTVLLVSHDMSTISRIAQRAILLAAGNVIADGPTDKVVDRYAKEAQPTGGHATLSHGISRSGSGDAIFTSVQLTRAGKRSAVFEFGEAMTIDVDIKLNQPIGSIVASAMIRSSLGEPVHDFNSANEGFTVPSRPGFYHLTIDVPIILLYPGQYFIELWMGTNQSTRLDYVKEALQFIVVQSATDQVAAALRPRDALVYQPSSWSCRLSEPRVPELV